MLDSFYKKLLKYLRKQILENMDPLEGVCPANNNSKASTVLVTQYFTQYFGKTFNLQMKQATKKKYTLKGNVI